MEHIELLRQSTSASKISKVEISWYLISNNIGEVGLKFFIRMFDEHPDLLKLFPFGEDSVDPKTGRLVLNQRTKVHIQAHATAVMRVVGTCVAGLTSIENLIPRLRLVGETHKTAGVQGLHYDILYRNLVRCIKEEVGPTNWDDETEAAWLQAYSSISDLMKRPSKRLETEPLRGWGIVLMSACVYFSLMTPFQMAGFLVGNEIAIAVLQVLDVVAAIILFLDFGIDLVLSRLRLKRYFSSKTQKNALFKFLSRSQRSLVEYLQDINMDRWVPWRSLDIKVLMSFPLQILFAQGFSNSSKYGLHWSELVGLIRISCIARVMHFLQCAENNTMLKQQLDADRQLSYGITKLLMRLAFILHLSACMWCTIARVEMGKDAEDFETSAFFPENILGKSDSFAGVFNSYSRAIHWAFVNLSGIGNVDSVPTSTFECWFTIIVHMIGAIFYAVVTGVLITILEDNSKREGKIGSEIAKLSGFMKSARVNKSSQDRIMKGYMMRNVLTASDSSTTVPTAAMSDVDLDDDILGTLPGYLRMEVAIYARAELIRRHDKFFYHCSNSFLVELAGNLTRQKTLLSGDFLMKRGEDYAPEFVLIENGTLHVGTDQNTIKVLGRGDVIGRAWLLQMNHDDNHNDGHSSLYSADTDWLRRDGTAGVSIRATSSCTLLTGLNTARDIKKLEEDHKVDFKLLRAEVRAQLMDETERRAIAMRGIARAVRRFKKRRQRKRLSMLRESGKVDTAALKKLVDEDAEERMFMSSRELLD